MFSTLKKVPTLLKRTSEVGYPEELEILKYYNVPLHLWAHVMTFIPLVQYSTIARTSKFFYAIITTNTIYEKYLAELRAGDSDLPSSEWVLPIPAVLPGSTTLPVFHSSDSMSNPSTSQTIPTSPSLQALPKSKSTSAESISSSSQIILNLNDKNAYSLFSILYQKLLPYYLDFRRDTREYKLYKHFKKKQDVAGMLRKLKLFGKILVVDDFARINFSIESSSEYFESAILSAFEAAYDRNNTAGMRQHAETLYELNGCVSCVQLLISKNPLFFSDSFQPLDNLRFLVSTPLEELVHSGSKLPLKKFTKHIVKECKKQALLISTVFNHYSEVLVVLVRKVFEEIISEYIAVLLDAAKSQSIPLYLTSLTVVFQYSTFVVEALAKMEQFKDSLDKLYGLVVDLVKPYTLTYMDKEVEYLVSLYTQELDKWKKEVKDDDNSNRLKKPVFIDMDVNSFKKRAVDKLRNSLRAPLNAIGESTTSLDSGSATSASVQELTISPIVVNENLERLDSLVSLDLVVKLINYNKEAVRRTLVMCGLDKKDVIQKRLGRIYSTLVRMLYSHHLKLAFEVAQTSLSDYKPYDMGEGGEAENIFPLIQFFELMHMSDIAQQLVDVYYLEQIKPYVDESNFLSEVVSSKKKFEVGLDDLTATGMDKAIQVMMDQLEYVFTSVQQPTDFNPPGGEKAAPVLVPTEACQMVIACIQANTKLLVGLTDKTMMDVFYEEIGIRTYHLICKNIKKRVISIPGGFRLISDLNLFRDWSSSLGISEVGRYFEVLQEIGNLYVVRDPETLKKLVNDASRYRNYLRIEELMEFVERRADYKSKYKKLVESGMLLDNCSIS